ncbi:MAG: c-type cytochrome biogenesis protein CcmI [Pseudomonadota bacterium]
MGFWVITLGLAALCCGVLARAVLRRRATEVPAAAYDLQVYRDQLKDVEHDVARGVISQEEADRLRTEVSRRILAADAKLQGDAGTAQFGTRPSLTLVAAVCLCLLGGSVWIYEQLGAPGLGDLPLAERIAASDKARLERLTQAEVEERLPEPLAELDADAGYVALVEQLRAAVEGRPGDAQGLSLLARHEAGLGNFRAAHRAQLALLEAKGDAVVAEDFSTLADMMISAAQGYVSSDAEKALRAALARDPEDPRARYYLGVYMLQVDRPDAAFRLWKSLLEDSRMDDPWTPTVLNRIGEVALRAGVQYDVPDIPGLFAGPTDEDIEAAAGMSAEDRAAMISDMVASLSARLANQGGTSEEWARLIRAHGVLGNAAQARAIWEEAEQAFASDDAGLTLLQAAAKDAGVLH